MPQLTVKIITPETVLYEGSAEAVATKNIEGPLSILPEHANFISIIDEIILLRRPDGRQQEIKVEQGVLYCRENNVEIYIGIGSAVQLPPEKEGKSPP